MYVQPHKAPWDGKDGKAQQLLGVENACLLAKSFAKNDFDEKIDNTDLSAEETARKISDINI